MGASLHGNPVLAKPTPSVSDGFQVPRLVRNQGIRLGASVAGQAVSAGGALVTARGVSLRSQSGSVRRYEPVRKSQLRAKGLKPQKGVSYLPESDRRVQRWQERRLRAARKPVVRGATHIRVGTGMMAVGRVLPTLAFGYIAYQYLPEESGSRSETPGAFVGANVKDNIQTYVSTGLNAYSVASVVYGVSKSAVIGRLG